MTAAFFSEPPPDTTADRDADRSTDSNKTTPPPAQPVPKLKDCPDDLNTAATPRPQRINPWMLFIGAIIPNWFMCRAEVSQGAKLCYARLMQYGGKEGHVFPKQDTLAVELGVTGRQVRSYLAELARFGLIESEQHGLRKSNDYYFLDHPWIHAGQPAEEPLPKPDRQSSSGQERKSSSGQDRKQSSVPTNKETQVKETQGNVHPHSPPKGDCAKSKGFSTGADAEAIYAAFPRKVGKPAALRAIGRALRTHPVEFLLARVALYAATYNGEAQFIPHPATWFNQARFNDDPATWRRTVGPNGKSPPAIIRPDKFVTGVSKL